MSPPCRLHRWAQKVCYFYYFALCYILNRLRPIVDRLLIVFSLRAKKGLNYFWSFQYYLRFICACVMIITRSRHFDIDL